MMATASLVNVVSVRPLAWVSERRGARRTLAIGCLIMAAGALGFAAVDSLGPFAFFCRTLHGLGWAFMFSSSGSLVLVLAPPGRLSQAIALHGSSNLLTNAIGPALAEPGIALIGPAPVFAAAAAVSVVGAWLCLRIDVGDDVGRARPPPPRQPAPPRPAPGAPRLRRAGRGGGRGRLRDHAHLPPAARPRAGHRPHQRLPGGVHHRRGGDPAPVRALHRPGGSPAGGLRQLLSTGWWSAPFALRPGTLALFGGLFGLAHGLFWPSFMAVVLQTVPRRCATDRCPG